MGGIRGRRGLCFQGSLEPSGVGLAAGQLLGNGGPLLSLTQLKRVTRKSARGLPRTSGRRRLLTGARSRVFAVLTGGPAECPLSWLDKPRAARRHSGVAFSLPEGSPASATAGTGLGDAMPGTSQPRTATCCVTQAHEAPGEAHLPGRGQTVGAGAGEDGGDRASVWEEEKVSGRGDGHAGPRGYVCPRSCTRTADDMVKAD